MHFHGGLSKRSALQQAQNARTRRFCIRFSRNWGQADLISGLATAAELFRQDSEAKISRLQSIQEIMLISALVVLLVEALLIFLPAQLSVNHTIRRLERRKKLLGLYLDVIQARNKELLRARQKLMHVANHDELTGLYNRRAVYGHPGTGR